MGRKNGQTRGVWLRCESRYSFRRSYWPIELATEENTLFELPPINRMVPTTSTRMTASITAYSAMSWPSSSDHNLRKVLKFIPSPFYSVSPVCNGLFENTSGKSSLRWKKREPPPLVWLARTHYLAVVLQVTVRVESNLLCYLAESDEGSV